LHSSFYARCAWREAPAGTSVPQAPPERPPFRFPPAASAAARSGGANTGPCPVPWRPSRCRRPCARSRLPPRRRLRSAPVPPSAGRHPRATEVDPSSCLLSFESPAACGHSRDAVQPGKMLHKCGVTMAPLRHFARVKVSRSLTPVVHSPAAGRGARFGHGRGMG